MHLQAHTIPGESTVVFNGWDKRLTRLLQDEGKKLAKYKIVFSSYGSENCNSEFLQDFREKKKNTGWAK